MHNTTFGQPAGGADMSAHCGDFLHIVAAPTAPLGGETHGHSHHHVTSSFPPFQRGYRETRSNWRRECSWPGGDCAPSLPRTGRPRTGVVPLCVLLGRLEEEVAPLATDFQVRLGHLP